MSKDDRQAAAICRRCKIKVVDIGGFTPAGKENFEKMIATGLCARCRELTGDTGEQTGKLN